MPSEYKILITGPMGVGKTTAIRAVSTFMPVSTEAQNLDRAGADKDTTTVAMDYGEVELDGGDRLRIYGTPGQARFEFMWKVLGEGALGVVILIDNSRADPLGDFAQLLDAFAQLIRDSAAVVGVTRLREHPAPAIGLYSKVLHHRELSVPVFSVDGRRREDVLMLLDALLHQIEAAAALGSTAGDGS